MQIELSPELQDLDAIRISNDWSWVQLSIAMAAAGFPVASRTLHYLVKGAGGDAVHEPRDRTLYKIRKFLAYQQPIDAARDAAAAARDAKNARRRTRRHAAKKNSGGRSALSVAGGR